MDKNYPRLQLSDALQTQSLLTIRGDGGEILRFEQNGDIYVKGRMIGNDKEVVEGFREFLRQHHK